jgi:energy-coupling factor transport system substrate-specific component
MMIALLEAVKHALAFLPNVELVTLFVILFTLFFQWKILYVLAAFVLIEGCLYGFGIWWIMYLYIWPLLALLTRLFCKNESVWFWSIFSAFYGLIFGALCAIPYFFVGGIKMAFTWWVAGIPFDLIHCVSNFVLCLVLFIPLRTVLKRVVTVHS